MLIRVIDNDQMIHNGNFTTRVADLMDQFFFVFPNKGYNAITEFKGSLAPKSM